MKIPPTFRAFRNRNFSLFWWGQVVSLMGTWMQRVGQAWLVLEITGSPLALGTVAAAQFLPISVLTLFAGVWVDRLPKRRILLATQMAALVLALVLAVLVHLDSVRLWHVYVLAIMLGLINAIDNPARKSFLMEIVGRGDLVNAVALNSTLFNAARIVGPAVGGFLISTIGLAPCFYLNAASFVAVLIGLHLMDERLLNPSTRVSRGPVLAQLREGLAYVLRTPSMLTIVILMFTLGTFAYNFNTTLPLVARDVLGQGAGGFGALLSAQGLGSLVLALVVASRQRVSEWGLFVGASGVALLLAALAVSNLYPLSLGIMVALGGFSIVFSTAANSLMQLNSPEEMRGRVMSLHTLFFLGTTPVGGLVAGALAEQWGIQKTLGIQAGFCLIGLTVALAYRQKMKVPPRGVEPGK
jgi:MFS family permease